MKNLMKNFRELSYFELLETNGGYGGSSGGGGSKKSGSGSSRGYGGSSSGSSKKSGKKSGYNALTSGLSAPRFVAARERGRMTKAGRTAYYTPSSGVPTSPSAYSGSSSGGNSGKGGDPYLTDSENKQKMAEIEKTAYKGQYTWNSDVFGDNFGGEACCATSILNEVSEVYTRETGNVLTAAQQDAAMTAAINAGMVNDGKGSKESAAYVNDKVGAATVMAKSLGLEGSFSYREGGNEGDGTVYKLTKSKDGGKTTYTHFVNSAGNGRYYDPSTGTISHIGDFITDGRIQGVTTFTLDYHR